MRIGPKLLIAAGITDLLIVLGAFVVFYLAWASQYAALTVWVRSLSPNLQPGSAEYDQIPLRVLQVLRWTSPPFLVVAIALGLSGVMLILAGRQRRSATRLNTQAPQP